MLKLSDTLSLAGKKIKQRKISSFFSGCFVALGTIILLVSSIGVYAVKNFLENSPKGIEDTHNLVSLRENCSHSLAQYMPNDRAAVLSDQISQNQQTLESQKDILTEAQKKLINDKIVAAQKELATINASNTQESNTCGVAIMAKDVFLSKFPNATNIYTQIIKNFTVNADALDGIKLIGELSDTERSAKLGNSYGNGYIPYDHLYKSPVLSTIDAFTKNGDVYKPKVDANIYTSSQSASTFNASFEISDDKDFLTKYLSKDQTLTSSNINVLNVIMPYSFVDYLEVVNDNNYTSYFNPYEIFAGTDQIDKMKDRITTEKELMNKWVGKEFTISEFIPSKVEYKENTDPNTKSYSANIEQITEFKKGEDLVVLKIVGFSDQGYGSIKVLNLEYEKINVDTKIENLASKYFKTNTTYAYFANFKTAENKKSFLSKYTIDYTNYMSSAVNDGVEINSIYYTVSDQASGTQAVLTGIQIVKDNFLNYVGYALLAIASIIILLIVSKTVTESTKEIAIFRSFGAKRFDVAKIYLSYILMLIVIGFVCAIVVSYALVAWMNYSSIKTLIEIGLFYVTLTNINGNDFTFLAFPLIDILSIFGIAVGFGLVAAIIPTFRATRIQPIVAMRNE